MSTRTLFILPLTLGGLLTLPLIGCSGGEAPAETPDEVAGDGEADGDDGGAAPDAGKSDGSRFAGKAGKGGGKAGKGGGGDGKTPGSGAAAVDKDKPPVKNKKFSVDGVPVMASAKVEKSAGRIITRIPSDSCMYVTATPLAFDDQLVVVTHHKGESGPGSQGCDKAADGLGTFAISATTGEARKMIAGTNGEVTPVWADGTMYIPVISDGSLVTWRDGQSWAEQTVRIAMDSPPLWDSVTKQLIIGTVNSPSPVCQNASGNPDCGVVLALDANGVEQTRLDSKGGFRAWVVAGIGSDGDHYYLGSGSAMIQEKEDINLSPCALVKLNKNLEIVKSYDDGDPGCRDVGRLKSAPIGEVPIANGFMWAQYLGSTDGADYVPFVKLKTDTMEVACRAKIPAPGNRSLSGFYTGPVVDELGRAYLAIHGDAGRAVYRVDEDCKVKTLYVAKTRDLSSPTLADDKYVLVGDGQDLAVIDRETGATTHHRLGSTGKVIAGPVVTPYGVSVIAADATVTTLTDLGITGYGKAPWPRFRKDNQATATNTK